MKEVKSPDRQLVGTSPSKRNLKIEILGDPYRGKQFSGIRLKGRWLTSAGFDPGAHVAVTVVSPGLIELKRVAESEIAGQPGVEAQQNSPDLRVSPQGSVWLFYSLTDKAREWMAAHCPPDSDHQYFAGALVVESRYVRDLLGHAEEDGLVISE